MQRYRIYIYWVLMLAPTLMIGVGAIALLQRERKRIDERRESELLHAARQKASLFADRVRISLDVMEQQLLNEVIKIDESEIPDGLEKLGRTNPLARNVFAWTPGDGVVFPNPRQPATKEQRRFLLRYEAMFNGAKPWLQPTDRNRINNKLPVDSVNQPPHILSNGSGWRSASTNDANRPSIPAQQKGQQTSSQAVDTQMPAQRAMPNQPASPQQGAQLNSDLYVQEDNLSSESQMLAGNTSNLVFNPVKAHGQGWLPWFSGNQLHLLGWAQKEPGGPVRGVEIEMMSFVSRLYAPSSTTVRKVSAYYRLTDGSGRTLYQEGDAPGEKSKPIVVKMPVGPNLPHWTVHCSWIPPARPSLGKTFLIVGGLLAGIFIMTILLGGSLLMWQARKDALELMQKTSFVSNVSHELKTPLTSIRMYAELLGEKRIKDESKKDKYLNVVVAESQRLSRLVNNVLDFSRLEQGRKKYSSDTLDLNQAADYALHNQFLRLQEAGITVEAQLAAEEIRVSTDRDALEQVFINLIDNACKYAGEGGELTITSVIGDGFAEVCIMDRGPGITGEHQTKIFEKFHRVDDTMTRNQDGVGLGLCIARRLLTDQGGDLIYRDREGGGACFTIRLPVS